MQLISKTQHCDISNPNVIKNDTWVFRKLFIIEHVYFMFSDKIDTIIWTICAAYGCSSFLFYMI